MAGTEKRRKGEGMTELCTFYHPTARQCTNSYCYYVDDRVTSCPVKEEYMKETKHLIACPQQSPKSPLSAPLLQQQKPPWVRKGKIPYDY